MAIYSKIVYAKTKKGFETIKGTIPQGLDPLVFIEDSREIWVCGKYFSVGYPEVTVTESSGSVTINIGESGVIMTTTGDTLSIRKGEGNRVVINSTALSKVDTKSPLKWDATNKELIHEESGVEEGAYGASTAISDASIFSIPYILVDSTGHIKSAKNTNVKIRDYVEQLAPVDNAGDKCIILSNSVSTGVEVAPVRKANGLTYDDNTGLLKIKGGITAKGPVNVTGGDLTVEGGYIIGKLKGDVEGSAVPKIHISDKPEYGGASKGLYGHVTLKDDLPTSKPNASSDNVDVNNAGVVASAASPLMVWNAIEAAKKYVNDNGIKVGAYTKEQVETDISKGFKFSKDFVLSGGNIDIGWTEL